MCDINFKQYLILRKLYKFKGNAIQMDPNDRNYKFLLHYELIESEYISDGPFINLEPNGRTNITNKGINKYIAYQNKSRRHWQNIFIPQTLNVVVSIITTLVTYFILEYLKAP